MSAKFFLRMVRIEMRRIAHLLLAAPALGWSPWRPQDAIKTMAHASAHSFERIVKKCGGRIAQRVLEQEEQCSQ